MCMFYLRAVRTRNAVCSGWHIAGASFIPSIFTIGDFCVQGITFALPFP